MTIPMRNLARKPLEHVVQGFFIALGAALFVVSGLLAAKTADIVLEDNISVVPEISVHIEFPEDIEVLLRRIAEGN